MFLESLQLQTVLQGELDKPHFNKKHVTYKYWTLAIKVSLEKSVLLLSEYVF
jgi:hypothetical protein